MLATLGSLPSNACCWQTLRMPYPGTRHTPPAVPRRLGALDTHASQAVGARNFDLLGVIWRQAVLFLLMHTIPVAVVFWYLPSVLTLLGQPEDLMRLTAPYLLALVPAVWTEAFYR